MVKNVSTLFQTYLLVLNSFYTETERTDASTIVDVLSGHEAVKTEVEIKIKMETVFMLMVLILASAGAAMVAKRLFSPQS